ncbi:DUF3347 domain-containing protein [Aequorivita sp. Q41]|uniref:DUF3347 domain-containing protein n=1 Tax=Aequorivita sp. Q41 TaxID=3153300 RepID=UPI003241F2F4
MKKSCLILFAFVAFSISSCKNSTQQNEPEVVTVATTVSETYELAKTEAEFNDPQIAAIFNQYLQVEAALVNTDAEKTVAEAAKLQALVETAEVDAAAKSAIAAMAESNDIEVQRTHFQAVSTGLEAMLVGTLTSGTLYKQYCPMAFNNTGAYWISSSKDILNPYFGDKMLKCGRVAAEVK